MNSRTVSLTLLVLIQACAPTAPGTPITAHDDLVVLIQAADSLRRPILAEGVPDYSSATLAARYDSLKVLKARYAMRAFMAEFLESGMVPMEMIGEEIGSV